MAAACRPAVAGAVPLGATFVALLAVSSSAVGPRCRPAPREPVSTRLQEPTSWPELSDSFTSGVTVEDPPPAAPDPLPAAEPVESPAAEEEAEGDEEDEAEEEEEEANAASGAAGYSAAFTTQPGRNGAGIDRYCLRRIGPKDWDGHLGFLWKALSGEWLPRPWGKLTRLRAVRRSVH